MSNTVLLTKEEEEKIELLVNLFEKIAANKMCEFDSAAEIALYNSVASSLKLPLWENGPEQEMEKREKLMAEFCNARYFGRIQ